MSLVDLLQLLVHRSDRSRRAFTARNVHIADRELTPIEADFFARGADIEQDGGGGGAGAGHLDE